MTTMNSNSRAGRHIAWLGILLALSSWSYLATWAASKDVLIGFGILSFASWTFGLLGMALVLAGFTWMVDRSPSRIDRPFSMGAVGLLLFQSWFVFDDLQTWLADRSSDSVGWIGVLALVVTFLVLTFRVSDASSIRSVFAVVAVFLVLVPALEVARAMLSSGGGTDTTPVSEVLPPRQFGESSPDVFVVVLDAYGRSDVLLDGFGFDNTPFELSLADLGVDTVRFAKSNYSATAVSVASILQASYPVIGNEDDVPVWMLREIHAGNNALFKALHAAGYETHLFDNAWTFTQCRSLVELCHSTVLDEMDHAVAQRTPLTHFIPSLRIDPWVSGSVQQLRQAATVAGTRSDRPRLVFLHALIPHAPFQLNANCQQFWDPRLDGYEFAGDSPADLKVRSAAYIEQLQCTNSLVLNLVEAAPRDAILLITGDHGPRPTDFQPARSIGTAPDEILARWGTFTAYRFPEECEPIPDTATLVVVGARLFGCLGLPIPDDPARTPEQPSRFFGWQSLGEETKVTDLSSVVASIP